MATALKTSSDPVRVRSAFDLPQAQRTAIETAVKETFTVDPHIQFETSPDLVSGVELSTNGQKVAWSIADYLASLEKSVGELLQKDAKPKPKPEAKGTPKPAAETKPGPKPESNSGLQPTPSIAKGGSMNSSPDTLHAAFDRAFADISRTVDAFTPQMTLCEVGAISSVSVGIAKVSGLPGVGFDELVKFPGDLYGIAFNVDQDEIGVVLLGECEHLHAGDVVERTGRVMDVPVGDGLVGH